MAGQDEAAVSRLAQALAQTAPGHGLVFLEGDLGAGKTTFTRAFLRALGVTGPVRSPTYTLIEPYDLEECADSARGADAAVAPCRVLHLDLYRLGSPEELDYLGLRDEFGQALILVEWPACAGDELPPPDIEIRLSVDAFAGVDRRQVTVRPRTPSGTRWFQACQSRYGE
ncbi:tRNA (N6-adenosine(37)-N6)-threonylcarbamoyltransferase complex ATPase TsaE [Halothiobacillus diazotrophicus]|uniref:tRNA threonylcarbamoyladenosine biosynthesis protein TsaE n=1 Tax=Halothiobacillus diazotrophicus TaxID=1860122 RepID=A0A191ZKR3_9GAMM|nr:tRNA (N6-adenosine(37)-N6)-threonylcarbamoyltransferase complex ATPase TsaE [Halothiobacillus diazotrophicus]